MTLISLLLVLLIERVTTKSRYWQAEFYVAKYLSQVESTDAFSSSSKSWLLLLIIALPVLLAYLLLQELTGGLLELLISTAILMVCVGCPHIRATYKCFLQAASRGDMTACDSYKAQLTDSHPEITFGQSLVWQNYRHYTAVILWFTALGAPGAIMYVLVRELHGTLSQENEEAGTQVKRILNIIDWLPVRLTSLGFLVVGHFSRAFPTWLGYLPDPATSAKTVLLSVAKKAEEIEPDDNNCTQEPCTLVRLAKRNVMFLLVSVAVLTLTGWIN
jgi:AmpE protein